MGVHVSTCKCLPVKFFARHSAPQGMASLVLVKMHYLFKIFLCYMYIEKPDPEHSNDNHEDRVTKIASENI